MQIQRALGEVRQQRWPDPREIPDKLAFRDRLIDSIDHALIKRLRGLA